MSLDERLRTDLADAATAVDVSTDGLTAARQLGHRRKLRRQAAVAGTMAAVVALVGVATWRSLDTDPTDGSLITATQPTPLPTAVPTAEPADDVDPIVQARIATAPVFNRVDPVAVWTGEEVVIWGGIQPAVPSPADFGASAGAAYSPATDEWRTIGFDLPGRREATGVWSGSNLLIWGGTGACRGFEGTIVDCEPTSGSGASIVVPLGSARPVSEPDISARTKAEGLWTGDRMIVWGGFVPGALDAGGLADGAVFDPLTDSWETIAENPFQRGGRAIMAFYENSLVIGAGEGSSGTQIRSPAGWSRYSLDTAEWRGLPRPPVDLETFAAGVQVGENVVVFNGDVGNPLVKGTGAILNLSTDTWVELAGPPDRPDGVDGVAIGNRAVFLAPGTGRLLVYDLDVEAWTTWETGDDTLVGARTLVQAGDTQVMAWNGTTGEGVIVDITALPITPN